LANIKRANTSGVTKSGVAIADVPDMPTIGTATGVGLSASITYTAATTGGTATTFTAISTPGSITGTGSSPITVSGLTDGTSYTFRVFGTNSTGQGAASSASNSITAVSTVPSSYDSLGTVVVPSGGVSSVIFGGIPVGYRHLQLRVMGKITGSVTEAATGLLINETAITRSHYFGGDGSTAFTSTGTSGYIASMPGASATSMGFIVIDILDYLDTDKNKTIKAFNGWDNNGSGLFLMYSGLLTSTDAVKTIRLDPGSGNWAQYSSFALYGVK
jgi:hypothetical protein